MSYMSNFVNKCFGCLSFDLNNDRYSLKIVIKSMKINKKLRLNIC